jgi:hypothetical protein
MTSSSPGLCLLLGAKESRKDRERNSKYKNGGKKDKKDTGERE